MNLVVLADDAFSFLVAWEFMSLTSWALVMAHHRDPENRRAGYRLSGHGELRHALPAARLRPACRRPAGGYAFAEMRGAIAAALPGLVLILALLGAGSKAGLVPLHVWLPLAHPAAPSHVSALMSGVMTKVAIYGFIRIVFDLIGQPAWWWSIVVHPPRRHHRRARRAQRPDATRSQAPSRLSHGREYRHHLHRPRACACLLGERHAGRRGAPSPPRSSTFSITRSSRACSSSAPARS